MSAKIFINTDTDLVVLNTAGLQVWMIILNLLQNYNYLTCTQFLFFVLSECVCVLSQSHCVIVDPWDCVRLYFIVLCTRLLLSLLCFRFNFKYTGYSQTTRITKDHYKITRSRKRMWRTLPLPKNQTIQSIIKF